MLVVDESDEILNLEPSIFGGAGSGDGLKKSMVNDFLDYTSARMIFITNATWRIPDSIKRRFTFHLGFEDFSLAQRAKVWNELDVAPGIFSGHDRNLLAARYKANPSRIKQVFDICTSLGAGKGEKGFDALHRRRNARAR